MSIATDLADAAGELFDELGESVTVAGVDGTGLVTGISSEDIIVAGGIAENGGLRVTVKKADYANEPASLATVVARGRTLYVLSVQEYRALWALTCGDPAKE